MVIAIPDPQVRSNVLAYLQTLQLPPDFKPAATATTFGPAIPVAQDPGAWQNAKPGVKHHITVANLPAPYATRSVDNSIKYVKPPGNEDLHTTPASLAVPPGFTVKLFAKDLLNPRALRVAPNGDVFLAETGANRLHIFRADDGTDTPTLNQVYASNLDQPFGVAFYPPGKNPQWLYIANNNAIVRFPYHSGDVAAAGRRRSWCRNFATARAATPRAISRFPRTASGCSSPSVPRRRLAKAWRRSVRADIKSWEADHGVGAGWGVEANRADILVTDPEGKSPLRTFATGIRNPVGIAVNPTTGDVWTSVNERDGLGDNLVPDYITRVKEGGFYGWPWYYLAITKTALERRAPRSRRQSHHARRAGSGPLCLA